MKIDIDTAIESINTFENFVYMCRKKVDINNQNISALNTQIAEKKEIIKSLRAYWQYKPYMSGLYKCRSEDEKAKYKADNAAQIDKFTKAINVLNNSKKPDGTLPKAVDLNLEIERQLTLKKQIEERNIRAKAEFNRYNTIKDNLNLILSDKSVENVHKEIRQIKDEITNKKHHSDVSL